MKLKAPADCASASCEGEQVNVIDGFVEVSPRAGAVLIESHGFILVAEDDPALPPLDVPAPTGAVDPAALNRNQLFAELKARGVSVAPPITNDALREMLTQALATAPAAPVTPPAQPGP